MNVSISPIIPTEEISGVPYVNKGKGEMIALSAIKPEHIEEDELVRRLSIKAAEANKVLAKLRAEVFDEVMAYRELLAEKYNVKRRGTKGNITLTTVDTSLKLSIQVSDTLTFGPELEVAKEIIDGCIRRWSEGSNDNIRALIDQAFQVDKQGKLNTDRILGLKRLKITDETGEWEKAMTVISDSVRVMASKEHARFYSIDKESGNAARIPLDLANA
ncbi:sulfate transporter [Ochrobactrum sp. MYb29]|nr:sulfate transporter [Ochrobactrum sp. MYb29]